MDPAPHRFRRACALILRDDGHNARDLPAVAPIAFVQKDDAHLALLAGFQVHLPKPIDPHELTSVIARLAGRPLRAS